MELSIFDSLPMLFFVYSKNGIFLDVLGGNETQRVTNAKKLIGMNISDVFEEDMARFMINKIEEVSNKKIPLNFNYAIDISKFKDKNHTELLNEPQWFEVILSPTLNENGEVERVFWAQFSIQHYKKQLEKLEEEKKEFKKMAMRDELTGLYNRRYLYKKLQDDLTYIQENKNINRSILSVDIDNLTSINKNYGLFEGDKTIECLTEELQKKFKTIGICTRYREDNFIIILDTQGIINSENLAEEFREHIQNLRYKEYPKFTISIGITEIRRSDESIDDILERVEEALFYAKKSGKNRCYSTLI